MGGGRNWVLYQGLQKKVKSAGAVYMGMFSGEKAAV